MNIFKNLNKSEAIQQLIALGIGKADAIGTVSAIKANEWSWNSCNQYVIYYESHKKKAYCIAFR